ncbi:hypothetical protein C8Q78DRAFT_307077 [Trametes maxima]|nr:hypothetical protein C8Q78DRAFT_307077 [Trametes maxima]
MEASSSRRHQYIKNTKHMCGYCLGRGTSERKLSSCGRCGARYYCSRECQRADWPNHKPHCRLADMVQQSLTELDNSPEGAHVRAHMPDQLSLVTLSEHRERWTRYYTQTVLLALAHALRLPEDPSRSLTHFLFVRLVPRPRAEHEGFAGKFFRIGDAAVIEWAEAERMPLPWPVLVAQIRAAQQGDRSRADEAKAVAMLYCDNLPMSMIQMRDLPVMEGEVNPEWKEWFVASVENGVQQRLLNLNARRRRRCR